MRAVYGSVQLASWSKPRTTGGMGDLKWQCDTNCHSLFSLSCANFCLKPYWLIDCLAYNQYTLSGNRSTAIAKPRNIIGIKSFSWCQTLAPLLVRRGERISFQLSLPYEQHTCAADKPRGAEMTSNCDDKLTNQRRAHLNDVFQSRAT